MDFTCKGSCGMAGLCEQGMVRWHRKGQMSNGRVGDMKWEESRDTEFSGSQFCPHWIFNTLNFLPYEFSATLNFLPLNFHAQNFHTLNFQNLIFHTLNFLVFIEAYFEENLLSIWSLSCLRYSWGKGPDWETESTVQSAQVGSLSAQVGTPCGKYIWPWFDLIGWAREIL